MATATHTAKKEDEKEEKNVEGEKRLELIKRHVQALRKDLEGLSTSEQEQVLADIVQGAKTTKSVPDADHRSPPPEDKFATEKKHA